MIIPTYRRPDVLRRAIRSALAQTLKPAQVIVVDDGSEDSTPDVARSFPEVTFLQQANAGPAAARNLGLRSAAATYVASLDHDDEWDAGHLSGAVEAIEHCHADLAWVNFRQTGEYASCNYLGTKRQMLGLLPGTERDVVALDHQTSLEFFLFKGGPASNSALVFRRGSLGEGWDPASQVADDLVAVARVLLTGPRRSAVLTRPLWTKHEDEGSYSWNSETTLRRSLLDHQLVTRLGETSLSASNQRRWRKVTGNLRYKLAYHCLWSSGMGAALREARQAFADAGVTRSAIQLCLTAVLRKCARLAGLPPLGQLSRRRTPPGPE